MIRLFRHYIPKALVLLGFLETIIVVFSVYTALAIGIAGSDPKLSVEITQKVVVFSVAILAAMTAMGLYQREMQDTVRTMLVRLSVSFLVGISLMTIISHVFPNLVVDRNAIATATACAFGGIVIGRTLVLYWIDRAFLHRRILVVGAGTRAAKIARFAGNHKLRGVEIVGYQLNGDERGSLVKGRLFPKDVPLYELAAKNNVDELVVAIDDRRKSFPVDEILACKMTGIEVTDVVSFLEKQTGKIDVEGLHPSHLIFADGYVQTLIKPLSKRIFDVVVSLLVLTTALPIMLATALAIWLESGCRGSVIYRQVRVGAGNKPFQIMKFRSMVENAEKQGAQWAQQNDPRVTRIGRLIRATRIDELPQLINVLRGDMSFVGPRPERPEFVEKLEEKIPYYALRHQLKPGITGWAQICFPYGASDEDAQEKLQYDLYYMKNYSLFLDITVIMQTLQVVIWGTGAR